MTEKPKKRVDARRKKAKLKPSERTVFFTVMRLMDPASGELYPCLVPSTKWDRDTCRERGYKVGDSLMADLFKERNARFYRLAHGLAKFVRANTDGFSHLTIHATLKALQKAADVECDNKDLELDLGSLGKHTVKVREPRSLNFADMDDGRFAVVWDRLCDYVATTYFPDWSDAQVAEAAEFWEDKSA